MGLYLAFSFDFTAINWIFSNQLYVYLIYHALAHMVTSQLNCQIILLLKRPLTHSWSSPLISFHIYNSLSLMYIPGGPKKTGNSQFSRTLLWSTVTIFFSLLDRAYFPHNNNTKIIKFGWELFILWVISYGLSFSGFARFPEFRRINDSFGRP